MDRVYLYFYQTSVKSLSDRFACMDCEETRTSFYKIISKVNGGNIY